MPAFIGSRAALLARPRLSVQDIANAVGLTPALALDAGASASYPGAGQTWTDLSGNARHFVRGANDAPSTDDPTFNGTAGQLSASEFWSFDGGDFFTKATANGAFFNGLHKGAAEWWWVMAYYAIAGGAQQALIATKGDAGSSIGVRIIQTALDVVSVVVANGSTNTAVITTTQTVSTGAWNVVGGYNAEGGGANASFVFINEVVQTYTAAITSPSASDASQTANIAAQAGGGRPLVNGARLGAVGMGSGSMTRAQFDVMSQLLRRRFA